MQVGVVGTDMAVAWDACLTRGHLLALPLPRGKGGEALVRGVTGREEAADREERLEPRRERVVMVPLWSRGDEARRQGRSAMMKMARSRRNSIHDSDLL